MLKKKQQKNKKQKQSSSIKIKVYDKYYWMKIIVYTIVNAG